MTAPLSVAAETRRPQRRSVRVRMAALYVGLFLVCAAAVLAISNAAVWSQFTATSPASAPVHGSPLSSTTPLAHADAQVRLLQLELSATKDDTHRELVVGSAIAFSAMAAVSLLLGWYAAGRMLRPVREMTAATRRITEDNLHERLAVAGPEDELKDLGDTIDELLERLEGAFGAQRRFVANASHELRTPLATMRASLDVAEAKPGGVPPQTASLARRLRTELDRVDGLLDGFLFLARAQHGTPPDPSTVSLGALVAGALAARSAAITARGLTVVGDSAGTPVAVRGSEVLLRRLVDNVIDNAVSHNREGGWIRVAVEDGGDAARLVVENGGDALDQAQVDQLGQPFRRIGADRTASSGGAGLGLSIVAAIADVHGGGLELRARPDGGLLVAVRLPLEAGR